MYDWLLILCLSGLCSLATTASDVSCPPANGTACQAPALCSCQTSVTSAYVIYCRGKHFPAVPRLLPFTATEVELTLAFNDIRRLDDNDFLACDNTEVSLTSIDLSDNKISVITDGAFNGLQATLTSLKLHVNLMRIFPTAAIGQLTQLTSLTLRNFNVSQLPSGALSTLSNLVSLELIECGLSTLQASDLASQQETVQYISLSGNKITAIPNTMFANMRSLQTLDLSYNLLRSIKFDPLPSLLTLRLTSCRLSSPGTTVDFSALGSLKQLTLSLNGFTAVPASLISHSQLPVLEELYLDQNSISELTTDSLSGLSASLHVLVLSNNNITHIGLSVFTKLKALHILDMSNQDFSATLSPKVFLGLERSLKQLKLSKVGFSELHFGALINLRALEKLLLDENNISYVPNNTFAKLNNLSELDMSGNGLTSLTQRQVHGLEMNLTSLTLLSNEIASIDNCTFSQFEQLEVIHLDFNPLVCDCRMLWLWNRTQYNPVGNVMCAQPSNTRLADMHSSELVCNSTYVPARCEKLLLGADITISSTAVYDVSVSLTYSINIALDVRNVTCFYYVSNEVDDLTQAPPQPADFDPAHPHKGTCSMEGLRPLTMYTVCVSVYVNNNQPLPDECADVSTMPHLYLGMALNKFVAMVLGVMVGCLLLIVILAAYCSHRRKRRLFAQSLPKGALPEIRFDTLPTAGDKTHVFSRMSKSSEDISGLAVNGRTSLSPDEQDKRIRLMIRAASASTHSLPGMLAPTTATLGALYFNTAGQPWPSVDMRSAAGRQQASMVASGEYEQLPDDAGETYDEIPADESSKLTST